MTSRGVDVLCKVATGTKTCKVVIGSFIVVGIFDL